jgi:hypothetical protein
MVLASTADQRLVLALLDDCISDHDQAFDMDASG